jgi:hypothetical protein
MGIGALSLGVKWPGREADYSPPSSAKVKNMWRYTSTPPVRLNGVVIGYSTGTDLPTLYIYHILTKIANSCFFYFLFKKQT